jgi:hypothetical protein
MVDWWWRRYVLAEEYDDDSDVREGEEDGDTDVRAKYRSGLFYITLYISHIIFTRKVITPASLGFLPIVRIST